MNQTQVQDQIKIRKCLAGLVKKKQDHFFGTLIIQMFGVNTKLLTAENRQQVPDWVDECIEGDKLNEERFLHPFKEHKEKPEFKEIFKNFADLVNFLIKKDSQEQIQTILNSKPNKFIENFQKLQTAYQRRMASINPMFLENVDFKNEIIKTPENTEPFEVPEDISAISYPEEEEEEDMECDYLLLQEEEDVECDYSEDMEEFPVLNDSNSMECDYSEDMEEFPVLNNSNSMVRSKNTQHVGFSHGMSQSTQNSSQSRLSPSVYQKMKQYNASSERSIRTLSEKKQTANRIALNPV